jgi:hypothetical protein
MLRDVFYYGTKPNVHPRERFAESLEDARQKCTTDSFWIINEFCDYRGFDWDFDFEFLPDEDVWAEEHNNVWPSQHQKDSGTWLCPKEFSDIIVYRSDVNPVIRKSIITDNWQNIDLIDKTSFDFSWHSDPTDPPYVYQFGTQWQKTGGPRYVMPEAHELKYVTTQLATRLPSKENWKIYYEVEDFDFSWHPDESGQPYVYVFGNQWYSAEVMPTLEYEVPGAQQPKFVNHIAPKLSVNMDNWIVPDKIDTTGFDFSWRPEPGSPKYIYEFATQWQKTGGPQYVMPGATEKNYVDYQKVSRLPSMENWSVPENLDISGFDFSWHPDDTNPLYNYVFATQWAFSGGPVYSVPGATETKYVDDQIAIAKPDRTNWVYNEKEIDVESFDWSWHPYVEDQPYVYQFGTQWQKTGGPRYITPGANSSSPTKYIDTRILKATRLSNRDNPCWNVMYDIEGFDFSWHPDDTEEPYIYIFGNNQYPAEEMPTVEYCMSNAKKIKYVSDIVAQLSPTRDNWVIHTPINEDTFDFSWRPHPKAPPYIYVWGNPYEDGRIKPTVEYHVHGATEKQYMDELVEVIPQWDMWQIPDNINKDKFDFSWRPDPLEPPFIYEFATQWQKTGGPRYIVPGGVEVKYVDFQKAERLPSDENWTVPDNVVAEEFDFSWHPDATSPDYIYVFPTPWAFSGGPVYTVPGATEFKYIDDQMAKVVPNMDNWVYDETEIDVASFDFSWHPYLADQPYIYQFGTQHQKTGGPKYYTPGTTSGSPIKYIDTRIIKAKRLPNKSRFTVLGGTKIKDFDWSWHPDDTSPPYVYVFGNNWYPADEMPTVEYKVEGSTEAKFVTDIVAKLAPDMTNWTIPAGVDAELFDFSWIPHPTAKPYVYQFGTSTDAKDGPIYTTPGTDGETINVPRVELDITELVETESVEDSCTAPAPEEVNLSTELHDVFFVDKGNPESADRFEALKAKFGTKIQKTRYLNSWVDTINRCTNRATSQLIWVLNSELDYSDFDFEYYPNPWQMKMVHVFGTQWSHWGTTFMINRETFPVDTKYIKIIEHLSNLNFVKHTRAKATACVHDVVMIDHGYLGLIPALNQIERKTGKSVSMTVKYAGSYLNTLRNFVTKLPAKKEHYLWICSSVCDYEQFDFTYICDPFARENLHVFPSGTQKFGDTFFLDVNKTRELIDELEELQDYDKVNYNSALKTERLPEPIIINENDTHAGSIQKITGFPYVTLVTADNKDIETPVVEPMNLWAPNTKNIIITSTGASRIVVPAEAKDVVENELYDYPYIKRAPKLIKSSPLDIVFLSNGETGAEENWEHLLKVTKGLPNRVVRVDGVNGRAAAYHAAVTASETPWCFTVFAKLQVSPKFDFNWQPDRMQVPKHYIFHAKNPVNGLTYGHQAMIAYNKKLTLANEGRGLDFTLDDAHEVVPLISGTAKYNTDAFSTWRTAFREVLKLKADDSETARERLDIWMNKAEGDFSQYSIKGALDADEYYDEVSGDFDALKLSYEWAWLKQRFDQL